MLRHLKRRTHSRPGRVIGDPAGWMTAEAAADVIERLAVAAGLSGNWSGHSLRCGFATAARAAGHDPLEIARASGWADGSPALARYKKRCGQGLVGGTGRGLYRTGLRRGWFLLFLPGFLFRLL